MGSVVEVKVVQVGNSLGVIFPKWLIKERKLKKGQGVSVNVFPGMGGGIDSLLGIARGAKPFVREDCGGK